MHNTGIALISCISPSSTGADISKWGPRVRRFPRGSRKVLKILTAASLLLPTALLAEPSSDASYKGAFSFVFENDVFAGNDNNYSNGASFQYTSARIRDLKQNGFVAKTARAFSFLPAVGNSEYNTYVTYRLAQEMYTPPDITLPAPQPGDQPYAGVLMADLTLYAKSPKSLHTYILAVGVVGPASGAEPTQKFVHELIGSAEPMGWDTQLSNELLLNVGYAYDRRLLRNAAPKSAGYDLTGAMGATLGNYATGASADVSFRVGYDLPDTYGTHSIRGGGGGGPSLAPPPEKWRLYGSLGLGVSAIGRFLPTDGNTFKDSLSGDRDDFYTNASIGITAAYKKLFFEYSYSRILGGKQRPGDTTDDFGTLTFTWYH